ncbi:NAD-dependent epimerase/dehydratase family protein [Pseudodesulfovibrio nedwellii]|nr:NAD-dependent epimerase/dehydratase family protein [Pseudodesulfovibrio nedwellii]
MTSPQQKSPFSFWDKTDIAAAKGLKGPIIIVGVSGFIGTNLFYQLSALRDDVYGCSRLPQGSWRLQKASRDKLLSLDIMNRNSVEQLVHRLKPRTVFNLSAYGAYARQQDYEKIHNTNYLGVLHLLSVLADAGCDAFVHSGSSSEYGENCSAPLEDAPLVPNSHYSVSKAGASYLIDFYGRTCGVPCCNLRLYSIFGPWEERDRLIPAVVSKGLKGQLPPFVNPDISRDFVYVDDCTRAMVLAASTACIETPGASFNIASGIKTTIRDVAETSKRLFDIEEECHFGEHKNRKWDLPDWYGAPGKAQEVMGWTSRVSFEDGLAETARWERASMDLLDFATPYQKAKKISAIIACYKDNQAIPIMHKRLSKMFLELGVDYEIIFVNDCSPANDKDVITDISARDTHVIGISHSRNFGSQSAFLSGMGIASGDAVVLLDGDLQDPPEMIAQFYHKWLEGYDVVYGERVKREAPPYMQLAYKSFYRIFKSLADISIPVDAGDFSLIDKKVVKEILRMGEKDLFLRGIRAWVGFKQTGIPYVRPERMFGETTNSFFKNIWWAKKAIFSFSQKPLHYIQAMGVGMFCVSIFLGIYYFINYMVNPPESKGFMTVIMLVLILGSVQLVSLSVLGDYIGKILEESKQRPHYIRESIIYAGDLYAEEDSMTKIIDVLKQQ